MAHKSPQLVGVLLFLVVAAIFITAQIIFSPQNPILPVPEILSIRSSPPKKVTRFGEILAKQYSAAEKTKIENVALEDDSQVLGESDTIPTDMPTPTINVEKLDQTDIVSSSSGQKTIALIGDSMVDTLQHDLPQLKILLSLAYPNYEFKLYNFGVGASNIENGLQRLTQEYDYLGTHYPSVLSVSPDIIIIESFAYNPWSTAKNDLDRQWSTAAKMLDIIKNQSPQTKVILASTIAPNSKTFGDGVLNWNAQDKKNKATTIKAYLQNMLNFASSSHIPVANAYHPSQERNGEGNPKFISTTDHIHPSSEGGYLFSQQILDAIVKNKLIE
ncbi:SGNH/GDSL hydrolase family protein [Candidatus Gottesmanbacteria bacterium]|nr:SGNH/GDSL hydrolase family protein [Candidatus Gottesmanbacteria bacterium]